MYLNQFKVNKYNPKYYLIYNESIYNSISSIYMNLILDKISRKNCKGFSNTGLIQFYWIRIALNILLIDNINRGSIKIYLIKLLQYTF